MRRVVITGLGLVTPVGCGVEAAWANLLAGKSGARRIEEFDISDLSCQIAAFVPRGDTAEGKLNPDDWMEPKEQRKVDDFILYAVAAADQAIADSGWKTDTAEKQEATGVLIGSGIGGLSGIADASLLLKEKGARRISPFFIPGRLINLAGGYVSIRHGLKGPNHAVVTACATGTHAIGDAARLVALGDADVMVAGGTESTICRIGMAGFIACRALSTGYNDRPTEASRPYDKDRDGFVMGEGAGVVVLEEYEQAKARGAKIYAEVVGYGATSDGYDMVAPSGEGAIRCMRQALSTVKGEVDYINTHGTSTPVGDAKEMGAIREVFGSKIPHIQSTKSLTGHSLGAAGVQESIYSLLMMQAGFIGESAHIEEIDPDFADMPVVRQRIDNAKFDIALSNSFGFGGTNATLVFQRYNG